jgi:hypothetical protein
MPLGDGTGPLGMGSRTGRGKGGCRGSGRYSGYGRVMSCHNGGWFAGLAAPVVIALVRDLANPAGLLRRLARTLLPSTVSKPTRVIHDARYTVVDQKPDPSTQHKRIAP